MEVSVTVDYGQPGMSTSYAKVVTQKKKVILSEISPVSANKAEHKMCEPIIFFISDNDICDPSRLADHYVNLSLFKENSVREIREKLESYDLSSANIIVLSVGSYDILTNSAFCVFNEIENLVEYLLFKVTEVQVIINSVVDISNKDGPVLTELQKEIMKVNDELQYMCSFGLSSIDFVDLNFAEFHKVSQQGKVFTTDVYGTIVNKKLSSVCKEWRFGSERNEIPRSDISVTVDYGQPCMSTSYAKVVSQKMLKTCKH